ncbi:acyl-CoA dehydrogenase family protein [Aquicoccus sp. G2-2]|uniref:acyl-CoA dehydrogenase family protein n=1 Tax=Aquicoccus sp. G2-2 TaxID=3092120 RepID=UPI002ADF4809|nr:acyl-CoA dehydrogenase family protein [Aquicoccus sp. G2-2]MEA1114769.1 acyl-CoA dehydrogenase family protein [Aquicoccus sp. G2-2]
MIDLRFSDSGQEVQQRARSFYDTQIAPRHDEWMASVAKGEPQPGFITELQHDARAVGLWNMGIAELANDAPGTKLSNLDFAPIAELTGQLPWASKVFNCHAPDLPNMVMLNALATQAQRQAFLGPLLEGKTCSAFAMSEPDVASSDATNIATSIRRDGEDFVINGRKWYITGGAAPDLGFYVVMGVTNPEAARNAQHSMVLVPADTPGIQVERSLRFLGWDDHVAPIGEIVFKDVRVPVANLLGEEGRGFSAAQVRLGPARIHHAMRCIGLGEMLLDMMKQRAVSRRAFGQRFDAFGTVQQWIAEARSSGRRIRQIPRRCSERLAGSPRTPLCRRHRARLQAYRIPA